MEQLKLQQAGKKSNPDHFMFAGFRDEGFRKSRFPRQFQKKVKLVLDKKNF